MASDTTGFNNGTADPPDVRNKKVKWHHTYIYLQENVSLIKEINDLRRELKIARTQVHDLEAAMGLHRKANKAHATETLAQIMTSNKNAQMERELKEHTKVVELQQSEIMRLRTQLEEMESGLSRPNSGQKLAPIAAS